MEVAFEVIYVSFAEAMPKRKVSGCALVYINSPKLKNEENAKLRNVFLLVSFVVITIIQCVFY